MFNNSPSKMSSSINYSPTKLANNETIYDVIIDLDKAIYNPGDTITGSLKLILNRKLSCDLITCKLFGFARVFFTEISKTPGTVGQTKAFEQKRTLVEEEMELWTLETKNKLPKKNLTLNELARLANSNTIRIQRPTTSLRDSNEAFSGLDAGTYDYTFQFQLPINDIYTSFDVKNASAYIRYYIIVQAQKDGIVTLKKKLLFPVVKHLDLSNDRLYSIKAVEPVELENSPPIKSNKEILAKLQLEKRGYVPGEPLLGNITIKNNSSKSIKYCSLHIVQRTTCYSIKPIFHTNISLFETSGMGLPVPKIATQTTLTFPIRFHVPGLLPTLAIPDFIESEYFVRLIIGYKRAYTKIPIIELETPIIIGTHPTVPLYNNNININDGLDPPPPYDSYGNHGPPSYAAATSIGGISKINNELATEKEPLIDVNGKDYMPLCYYYNYAFASNNETEN